MDIDLLIFSKERTLQLKSLLLSLMAFSEAEVDDITVLYQDSNEVAYDRLMEQVPCRFIKQTVFYDDVIKFLMNSSKKLVCFMVDDLIFRDNFRWKKIEVLMNEHQDLECFSLRLGRNIKDGKEPVFDRIEPGIISWKTDKGLGKIWNYFWELSSSVYRKKLVLDYILKCSPDEITFPNAMESKYYIKSPSFLGGKLNILWAVVAPKKRVNGMACYRESKCFTQGVNLVADRGIDYKDHAAPGALHKMFLKGYLIDYKCLSNVDNNKPNTGIKYFRLVGPNGEVHPLSNYQK